jgi:hypothetical protein
MVAGISSWDMGHWSSLARSNILLCRHRLSTQHTCVQRLENKEASLYTLASRLQKQKAKFSPHMALCDFIGYFISPVLCDLLHVSILKFYLSAFPSLPLPHYQNTTCLFLFWLSSLLQYKNQSEWQSERKNTHMNFSTDIDKAVDKM